MERANVWLQSGLPAMIKGIKLIPQQHPRYKNLAYVIEGTQGKCLFLNQPGTTKTWVIKKFNPEMELDKPYLSAIRSLVPNIPSCIAATKRYFINAEDIKSGDGLYYNGELTTLLDNTILMPAVPGQTWKNLAQSIRSGKYDCPLDKRVAWVKSLVETVVALEKNGCAHRELCADNLIINHEDNTVYLIDWDSMYNGSLYYQKALPAGTEGYLAPWIVETSGRYDSRKTWNTKGDRFSLAILIAEILLMDSQSPRYYNGALFSQEQLQNPGQLAVQRCIEKLNKLADGLGDLFKQTVQAGSFENCPDPYTWAKLLDHVDVPKDEDSDDNDEQNDDEEHDDNEHSSSTLWFFICLLAIPFLLWIIYLIKSNDLFNNDSGTIYSSETESKITNTTPVRTVSQGQNQPFQTNQAINQPKNNNITPPQARNPEQYKIIVDYPDVDLTMKIDGKDIPMQADHSAMVELQPGSHEVDLFFSSVNFDDEEIEEGLKTHYSNKIIFDQKRTIKIRINRITKTWIEYN